MKVYGDSCVVSPGLIEGEQFTYLTESNTVLWVQEPGHNAQQRGVPVFFLGVSLATAVGVWIDKGVYAFIFPLLFVAGMAAWSLIRSLTGKAKHSEWKLFVGSTENPVLIFSTPDAAAFVAKRSEIERALLGRPLSEEE